MSAIDPRTIAGVLQEIGYDLSMSTFAARHNKQKMFSILQWLGLSSRFDYGWYIRGPYSPDLTRELFKIAETPGIQSSTDTLTSVQLAMLRAVAVELNDVRDDVTYMEALGSLAHLVRVQKLELDAALARLQQLKPHLTIPPAELKARFQALSQHAII